MFSTGFPSTQPAARPIHAPAIRSRSGVTAGTGSAAARIASRSSGSSAASGRGIASSSSSSSSASARSSGSTGSCEAPRPGAGFPPAPNQRRSTRLGVLPFLSRLSQLVTDQVLRLDPADPQTATPESSSMALHRASKRSRSRARISPATSAIVRPGSSRSSRLAVPTSSTSSAGTGEPERAREGAAHRRNRVGVAAVVHAAEHRLGVVAVRRDQEAERDRHLLDRVDPARDAGVRAPAWRTPRRPSRTARSPP